MGTVKTDAISTTYTSEVYPVGTRYVQSADEVNAANSTHYGDREWIFVYNDDSSAFAEGNVIMLDNSDYAPFHGLLSTATLHVHRILGVAAHAVAAGSYGWIIAKGAGEVQCDGGVAQGDRLVAHASTAGIADTITLNADATTDNLECVFAMALEADAGSSSGDKATCWINGVW
jgi:hypothetical protein|tara:strand:- start:88 stop:609 length:522 start_codon:yes stop_codon:yes gene_type:complete